MKIFIVLVLTMFCFSIHANTLKIASGEYVPYSGENIPNQGISTQIVKAVFKELKQDISIEFMPWNRAKLNTLNGVVAGSYPWILSSERLKDYYFSTPIHQYRVFAFTKKEHEYKTEKSLKGKIVCVPSGWDVSPYRPIMKKLNMQQASPISIESCFKMLAINRVDIIFANELVGFDVVNKIFGKTSPIIGSTRDYLRKVVSLHFIVSRTYPNAKKLITDFNYGLEKIKSNGVFDEIISVRSTCESCNQLGSL